MHFFNLLITFLFFNVILTIDYDQEWQNYKARQVWLNGLRLICLFLFFFQKTHSKIYSKKEQVRQSIFNSNLDRINEHNRQFSTGFHSFKMSVNKFSDMVSMQIQQAFYPLFFLYFIFSRLLKSLSRKWWDLTKTFPKILTLLTSLFPSTLKILCFHNF